MLQISLLGEGTITDAATGTVRTRSSRTVALVAYLVVHAGMTQSRQRIAGLFWPDSTDMQALTNLRRELHHLRHVLRDDLALIVTSKDLCWRDTKTCRVDVRTFAMERTGALAAAAHDDTSTAHAHAAAAVAQYRGDLLPGSYDDWILDARSELERQCLDLCDLICTTRSRTGDLTGALDVARRRIQLQPLEEIGYRNLMRLQAEMGDRAGAVSTYHRCASILERELGLDPDQATRKTLHQLLARGRTAAVRQPTIEPTADRSGLARTKLFGRSEDFGLLRNLWRIAASGRPSFALVHGDPGVGKTRLVAEVADLAEMEGAVVAITQCFGISGRLALAPVADWLRNPAIQSATAALDPVWRVEVDRLVPAAKDPGEPGIGSRAMVDAWQRHRFFEGMARALIGAGRPTLLVLDNLQWCDQETLAFLTFCLGLAADAPVMVAATLRRDALDQQPELMDWTARMRATGILTELSLSPLDIPDTARLAEAITGRPVSQDEAHLLQAMTGGFPLYVVEAARTTADRGDTQPPVGDLPAVLRSRLDQVTPVVRGVAGLAAAVGRNFTLGLLTEASDLDPDTVVQAVDELWRRRILRVFQDGYDFSHDLLRETAYAQVSPPKRWLLHRRLAQSLELLHAGDTDAVSAQLAEQHARGGRPDRAVTYYKRAADVAAVRFAHAEAIRLHQQALSIVLTLPDGMGRDSQELEILEAMAAPLNARHGYSSRELQVTLERSIGLAEALGREGSALTALIGLWASQFVQGNLSGAHQTATRAMTLVETDSELSGPAHFAIGGSALGLGGPAEALRNFELAVKLTKGSPSLSIGTRPDVHGTAWAAHAHWLLGHDEQASSCCRAAIGLARAVDHPYSLAVALAYGGITYQLRHDLSELRDTVAELRELCNRYGFAYYREWGLILDGWCTDEAGIGLAQQGIQQLKSDGSFARMPYWLSLLADLYARNNQPAAAVATLDAALAGGQARRDLWWVPEVLRMRAGYDGDDAAVSRLRTAAELARAHGSVALLRRCERDLADRGFRPSTPDVLPLS